MKKLVRKFLFFSLISVILICLVIGYRNNRVNQISWKLPPTTHIIFLGASQILRGINDTIYSGSINVAGPSERYLFSYLKLNKILKNNTQVDTVFLQFAPTDIWENADSKYYSSNEMSYFLPLYYPLFGKEEWLNYFQIDFRKVLTLLVLKQFDRIPVNLHSFGGFEPIDISFNRNQHKYKKPIWESKGHSINYLYLKKIKNLCLSHHVKLYYIYMPVFNPSAFYNQGYYYKAYNSLLSDIQLLDFSNWDCPDYYRADEHHLNRIGANKFTSFLKKKIMVNKK